MNRLVEFLKKIYLFLVFIVLEFIAFNSYQNNSVYIKGEIHNVSNNLLGRFYTSIRDINDYFSLKRTNQELSDRNATLMERLAVMENLNMRLLRGEVFDTIPAIDTLYRADTLERLALGADSSVTVIDPILYNDRYMTARVLNNTITQQRNFITLDRGTVDSVRLDLPVVCDDAIVGYIVAVNKNYSIAISVLSVDFKTSGMLKTDGSLCSVLWKGDNYEEADFEGISRYAAIQKGDTIVTTGFSSYFIADKQIGVVEDFALVDDMYYSGKMKLLTKFNKLRNVQIIFPDNLRERLKFEQEVIDK